MNAPLLIVVTALLSVCLTVQPVSADPNPPIHLIFDTDIGNDVDDVLALGMIHALESRGVCQLLAVTVTKDHPLAGRFVDCVNTFYGRGGVPIGIVHSGVTPDEGKFNGLAEIRDNDQLRYPHNFDPATADDAVTVLRRALAGAEDGSVVIAQVGFSTNLAGLLASPADDISPLSGMDLVKKKIRLLSMMAGAFEQISDGKGGKYDHLEYNIIEDVSSAQAVANDWPTQIVWSGFEIGLAVSYPATSIEQDYQHTAHHPLAEAYYNYIPPPHSRPSWDLASVLYAAYPDRGYFDLSPSGTVAVADNCFTTFTPKEAGTHRYLIFTPQQKIRVIEALVQLASQPPDSKK
jgi:purine nucleosidase